MKIVKKCHSCCTFQPDELLDAPTFTKKIKDYIIKCIDANIKFKKINNVFQIILNKKDSCYVCPLLKENGCCLGRYKPFDCDSWPFYVMKKDDDYVIPISNDCPVFNNIPIHRLESFVENKFKKEGMKIIK